MNNKVFVPTFRPIMDATVATDLNTPPALATIRKPKPNRDNPRKQAKTPPQKRTRVVKETGTDYEP